MVIPKEHGVTYSPLFPFTSLHKFIKQKMSPEVQNSVPLMIDEFSDDVVCPHPHTPSLLPAFPPCTAVSPPHPGPIPPTHVLFPVPVSVPVPTPRCS